MKPIIKLLKNGIGEITEKRSRFIGEAFAVTSETEVSETLASLRKKYWDARHIAYAFTLADGTARFSDDGEPHGTAGKPILNVISGSGVTDCLITVTRYFGGTLLGTGGLVRAYGEAASLAISDAGTYQAVPIGEYRVICSYDQLKTLSKLIEQSGGFNTLPEYTENVNLLFSLEVSKEADFSAKLTETFSATLKYEKISEKMDKKPEKP